MPVVGQPAPPFVGDDIINGGEFNSEDHPGETILLSFFNYTDVDEDATKDVITCLVALWNNFEGHGVQIVMVHPDFVDNIVIKDWLVARGVTFTVILGGPSWGHFTDDISDGLGGRIRPHTFIIDRNNYIGERRYGVHPACATLKGLLLDVIYIRDAIDLEMVMDVSGSMNSPSPSNPGGDTKFIIMREAIFKIGDYLLDDVQSTDKMGLIWFSNGVGEYKKEDSNGQKLLPIRTNNNWEGILKPQINALTPGGCTAMGAGLQTAFNTLTINGSTQKKFVILCTDGMQNRNPLVINEGTYIEIKDGDEWCGPPSQNVEGVPGKNITEYETCVHTIGIGITANYDVLLEDIARETGGDYKGTNDPVEDLDFIYFTDLCNCMAGGSPSILYHNTGSLSVECHKRAEIFYLNNSVRKITAILTWKKSQESNFMFWLYSPDGTLLNLHSEMKLYEYHCMATIYLPKRQNGERLKYRGEWRMMIRGELPTTPADYHVFIIGEDTDVKVLVDFPRKSYEVGDILPIKVAVLKGKKPIVIEPKEIILEIKSLPVPLPELLAEYKVSTKELLQKTKIRIKKAPKNPLILKLNAMTSEPQFQKRLRPITNQLSIQEGNLEYNIENEETFIPITLEQPGLHSFKITVRYEDPENGPICRTDMVSIIVGPGKADPEKTKINFMESSTDKLKGKIINITPRNKKGQLLGPGYSHELKLQVGKKEFDIEFKDLLDGTYQIELPVSKKEMVKIKEKDLDVDITFHKNLIWRGKL